MVRALLLAALCAAPAFAREVRGRVSRTEDAADTAGKGKAASGAAIRANVVTTTGDLVTITVVEGQTRVFQGFQISTAQDVKAGARIKAIVDDECRLDAGACTASEVTIEAQGGVSRIDAVRENAAAADAELDKGMDSGDPGMAALGGSSGGGRDRADDAQGDCPLGMVQWMQDGQRVMDENGQAACRVKRQFIKGELTNLGSDKLVVADSRFGIGFGYAHLDNSSYLALSPEVDMHFGDRIPVALGLGVPLNVRAYANGFIDHQGIKLRSQDYNQPSDYARILRFLTVDKKEDQFYLNISQLSAASIGHGTIVRRYSGEVDQNIVRVGAEIDAYGQYGGFEAFTGDVVQPQHFLAGLAFLKPLGWITGPSHDTLGWTSIGISTAMDLQAPYTLCRNKATNYPQVGDSDFSAASLGCTGAAYYEPGEPVVAETRRAQVVGVDLETKLVKTENSDIKPYLDYSRLLGIDNPDVGARADGGGGLTLGFLGRFNVGQEKVHAFRVVLEGRYYDGNYAPGYFDTFYEVQKFQYITGAADTGYEPKLRTILDRDPAHKRAGYYIEAAWQYNGGLAVMAAYEDSFHVSGPDSICGGCTGPASAVGARNLTLHIEYPAYSWLQFFGSFYRRSYDGAPFSTANPLGDNTLIYAAARLHILWVMFLNGRIYRSWQADPVLGEMKNLWGGDFNLEFGWEFDRSKKK